jgi:hypothetical protein
MPLKVKGILQVIGIVTVIIVAIWYLTQQFTSIETKLTQVVSTDIPKLKETLGKNAERADSIRADVNTITRKIDGLETQSAEFDRIETTVDLLSKKMDDELLEGISQLEQESDNNTEEVKVLSKKIDNLSKQYIKFLKLAEDKITVSIPPKWLDSLPYRKGTLFAVGISPQTGKLQTAQQNAVEQALSNMERMLERKTISAVSFTIRSAGKSPPTSFEELSKQFREQMTNAINELMVDFSVESYWVDPAGFVYALIALPIEDRINDSQFGLLIETLKQTYLSVTKAAIDDFEKNLQIELKTPAVDSISEHEGDVFPYIVKEGDNLSIIAEKNNMSFNELLKLNNLSAQSILYPDQILLLREK